MTERGAAIDPDACDGCRDCVEQCVFEAIELQKFPGSKKLKAVVDADKCFGCGLCVVGCDPGAAALRIAA